MPIATVTSKGQITIPRAIRERLGLKAGDRVAFRERADGAVVLEPETVSVLDLFGMLKPARRGVTLQDMDAAVARGAARR